MGQDIFDIQYCIMISVFLMGITAGLQTIRSRRKPDFEDPNESESFIHDIFPTKLCFRRGQEKESLEVKINLSKFITIYINKLKFPWKIFKRFI